MELRPQAKETLRLRLFVRAETVKAGLELTGKGCRESA